jgi:hypothetical protein
MRVCGLFAIPKSADFLQISAGMRKSYSKVFTPSGCAGDTGQAHEPEFRRGTALDG